MYQLESSLESDFLKKQFSSFYKNNFVDSVSNVELREFGFGVFKRKIANRNLSFFSLKEMNDFLRNESPLFFSYSNSCYKFPSRTPMVSKEWIKADLIYEFDADELGIDVEEIDGVQWFLHEHLNEAKKQVFRLIDFLESDFGFLRKDISINFSGKAGYHVHLKSDLIQDLNKKSRIELVDYLTGYGLDYANLGFYFDTLSCPKPNTKGLWSKRILKGIRELFESSEENVSNVLKFSLKKTKGILSKKEVIIDSLDKGLLFPIDEKKKSVLWKNVLDYVVSKEMSPIDRQTSVDLHKIVRVPNTLHGQTGFIAKSIPLDNLKEFDPFKDTIVFGDEPVRIKITKTPRFTLNGEHFGPFENKIEDLPLFVAVYLIGKGCAVLEKN
ncbi:MAG: DNA primase catalytic subunit PriS [Candidatus ainarchaeum sp.]|nr:DNA primase catalytic subunit PriS [Candidatus ainarchaeum sp.]